MILVIENILYIQREPPVISTQLNTEVQIFRGINISCRSGALAANHCVIVIAAWRRSYSKIADRVRQKKWRGGLPSPPSVLFTPARTSGRRSCSGYQPQ
jgi:hypothetical protein